MLRTLVLSVALAAASAFGQAPGIISHQGKVTVGGNSFTGTGYFKFALVDAAGTTYYWRNDGSTETPPTAAVSLAVAKGIFSVNLGDTTVANMTTIPASVFANSAVYLRVWFSTNSAADWGLLAPDRRITSVGYALYANTAASAASADTVAAANLTGTLPDARLSGNVALLNGPQTFTGEKTFADDLNLGSESGVYRHLRVGGGNSYGYLYGSYAALGDGLHLGYNYYFDAAGVGHCFAPDGMSSRLSVGYGRIDLATGGVNAAPTTRLTVTQNGNVGIGTSLPSTALEVAGTVKATAFSGDGAALVNIPASAVVTVPPGMVLIPAGAFTMGNSIGDSDITDAATMTITVSAFYMDVNLVSSNQWRTIYNWATLVGGYTFVNPGEGKAGDHPVQTVNWYDAVKWCNARSEQAGKTPVYYTDAGLTAVYKTGVVTVYANWAANGYRLPTEAEWEKAARGGLSGQRFPWGDTISQKLANYKGNTGFTYDLGPNGYNAIGSVGGIEPATSPVGSFAANGYGLNDMAGNVYALCWDWYGTPYGQPTITNPTGPTGPESYRVLRGGYWDNNAGFTRCANRYAFYPGYVSPDIGFRCVRGL